MNKISYFRLGVTSRSRCPGVCSGRAQANDRGSVAGTNAQTPSKLENSIFMSGIHVSNITPAKSGTADTCTQYRERRHDQQRQYDVGSTPRLSIIGECPVVPTAARALLPPGNLRQRNIEALPACPVVCPCATSWMRDPLQAHGGHCEPPPEPPDQLHPLALVPDDPRTARSLSTFYQSNCA
jgi:hypothetical protein